METKVRVQFRPLEMAPVTYENGSIHFQPGVVIVTDRYNDQWVYPLDLIRMVHVAPSHYDRGS